MKMMKPASVMPPGMPRPFVDWRRRREAKQLAPQREALAALSVAGANASPQQQARPVQVATPIAAGTRSRRRASVEAEEAARGGISVCQEAVEEAVPSSPADDGPPSAPGCVVGDGSITAAELAWAHRHPTRQSAAGAALRAELAEAKEAELRAELQAELETGFWPGRLTAIGASRLTRLHIGQQVRFFFPPSATSLFSLTPSLSPSLSWARRSRQGSTWWWATSLGCQLGQWSSPLK